MALFRVFVWVLALAVALPAAAAAPVVCSTVAKVCSVTAAACDSDADCRSTETCDPANFTRCPYIGVGGGGSNNANDADFSRCDIPQGCIAENGLRCPEEATCVLKPVPRGRCAEAEALQGCRWPDGAGECSVTRFGCLSDTGCEGVCNGDVTVPCNVDGDCDEAGPCDAQTCDLSTNDLACVCTNGGACSPRCTLDADCPGSGTCRADGTCIVDCVQPSDCPGTLTCAATLKGCFRFGNILLPTGFCTGSQLSCETASDCPTGERCRAGLGICSSNVTCSTDANCPAENPTSGCVLRELGNCVDARGPDDLRIPCRVDAECDAKLPGDVCEFEGFCTGSGVPCKDVGLDRNEDGVGDGDCPTDVAQTCDTSCIIEGLDCTNADCILSEGECRTASGNARVDCLQDADCPAGESCVELRCAVLCSSNADCTAPDLCQGGVCLVDCLRDDECAGGDLCDFGLNQSDVCGGAQGRCSDGDVSFGAFGVGLCIDLFIGETSKTNCGSESGEGLTGPRWSVENPGSPITPQKKPGSAFNTVFSRGPIVDLKGTFALDLTDPDAFGVRSATAFPASFYADWGFGSKLVSGGLVSAHINAFLYDAPAGWDVSAPVNGRCTLEPATFCIKDADCGIGDFCDPSSFVFGAEVARPGVTFIWTRDVDPSEPIPDIDGNGVKDCPPLCGKNYRVTPLEEEAIRLVGIQDRDAGVQLSFDILEDPNDPNERAGEGDVIGINAIFSLTWIPPGDNRCFIGGDPTRSLSCRGNPAIFCTTDADCGVLGPCAEDTRIGRCSGAPIPCDPLRERHSVNPTGLLDDCASTSALCHFCGGRFFVDPSSPLFVQSTCDPVAKRCTLTPAASCNVDADCGQFVTPQRGASATGPAKVLGLETPPQNPLAFPVGFDDAGFGVLGLKGRISGITLLSYDVRVPLLIITTTGSVALEFRDNDAKNVSDSTDIGPVLGGGLGVGAGGEFKNGTVFPAGGSCCDAGVNLAWAKANVGFPVTSNCETSGDSCELPDFPCPGGERCLPRLAQAIAWGPGANALPGCVGDNDPATDSGGDPNCNNPLGLTGAEATAKVGKPCGGAIVTGVLGDPVCNTGLDDVRLTATIGGELVPALTARRKVLNPLAPAPTLTSVGAGSARDINVLGLFNADALFKADALACPIGTDGEASCCIEGDEPSCSAGGPVADADGDGIPDDNGPPCVTGQTEGCSDNCKFQPNNSPNPNVQRDTDLDGQGDSCECGNADGNASLDIFDALHIAQGTLSPPLVVIANPRACDADGNGTCDIFDALRVAQATLSPPLAAIVELCEALVGPAP